MLYHWKKKKIKKKKLKKKKFKKNRNQNTNKCQKSYSHHIKKPFPKSFCVVI